MAGAGLGLAVARRLIEAMGGELDVIARFPEGSVKISNFTDLGKHHSIKLA